jgi:hypothetical protein
MGYPMRRKYTGCFADGTEVARLAPRHEGKLVEELIHCGERLVDGAYHDELNHSWPTQISFFWDQVGVKTYSARYGDLLEVPDYLSAQSRVESAGGLIEEEDLWVRDEPVRDAQSLLLATAEALFKGVPTMVSARDCRPKLAIRWSTRRQPAGPLCNTPTTLHYVGA